MSDHMPICSACVRTHEATVGKHGGFGYGEADLSSRKRRGTQKDLLPSSSFASSLLLIAVGRVGAGGVFNLVIVRAAEDELKD